MVSYLLLGESNHFKEKTREIQTPCQSTTTEFIQEISLGDNIGLAPMSVHLLQWDTFLCDIWGKKGECLAWTHIFSLNLVSIFFRICRNLVKTILRI